MNEVTRVASLRANTKPIDPDVVVPRAVREAAERATARQREAYPDQVPAEPPAPASASDTITIADPPASAPVTPPGNPEPQPAPTPAPTPTPATSPAPPEESWEHKFRSSEGRRARAETQLSQALDRLSALELQIQELRSAPPAPPAPAPAPTPAQLISEQERNEFGSEMIDVMGRRAQEVVSPELAAMRAELAKLEQKISGTAATVTRSARQELFSTLDQRLPEWRTVNDLPEFKQWLALPDPYFGVNRHSALLQAFEQNDTPRVLNFFKGFVSELAATTPADPSVTTPPAPAPAKPSLETLAAPGRARTPAQTTVPAEKQIITTADVAAFYAAVRRGAYRGREAEQAQLEQELFEAQRDGRVRAV